MSSRAAVRGIAQRVRLATLVVSTATLVAGGPQPALAQVQATYLHSLSNFEGLVPYEWGQVFVDPARDETYVLYQNRIRVFNASGMETYAFGDDLALGEVVDGVVDEAGDIVLLSYLAGRPLVTRCNFRGDPVASLEVRGLPEGVGFRPNRMAYRAGLFYFASLGAASVVITDAEGAFREHIDLLKSMEVADDKRGDVALFGFTVDQEGNLFFTAPVLFRVFKVAADRTVTSFGRSGSAPGRFGVVSGIVVDRQGHIIVADKLKCVVMVFDRDFTFLSEFGYRGTQPDNLIVPDDIAIDARGHLYVTQARKRGISVFALSGE